jgi:hypothetical protein
MVGYEGYYQYSNTLKIKSLPRIITRRDGRKRTIVERILPVSYTSNYARVFISKNNKCAYVQLHKFFAKQFIPNPENKKYVNHKNGNKHDFSLCNLEWATKGEDLKHAYRTGLKVKLNGSKSNFYKNKYLEHKTGGRNKNAVIVLDTTNGVFYECIKDAARSKNINYGTLVARLSGKLPNNTGFVRT